MKPLKLVVLDDYEGELAAAPAMAQLRQLADVTIFNRPLEPADLPGLQPCHVLLALRERTRLDDAFFANGTNLELVLQTGGHAYHLDEPAATGRGIVVALGRRVTRSKVVMPELVMGLMLALVRNIHPLADQMAKGQWPPAMGGSVAGRTLGILGYGRLGRPVARAARAFGMQVVAWDRGSAYANDDPQVTRLPLDELLAAADVVSIHLRLTEDSRGLIDGRRLARMKPTAFLINTSRGAIVDEDALVQALREKRIAGAGLDVFAVEPLPADSPLRRLPNVLLTPHIGWKVADVLHEFVQIAAEQLQAWLQGELPRAEVMNPAAAEVPRDRHGGLR